MTVSEAAARREAILMEVVAVATRYEQDTSPADDEGRFEGLSETLEDFPLVVDHDARAALLELAGRCVAWLEKLP